MTIKFQTKYQTIGSQVFQPKSELPSMTDTSFGRECDIEYIISNFVQRGIEPPVSQIQYGKQITSEDYAKSLMVVAECKSAYEALPSADKERFGNSVENFLNFVGDPANLRECYEKGYVDPASVSLADVYPERFYENTSGTSSTTVVDTGAITSTVTDVAGSQTATSNPTQT